MQFCKKAIADSPGGSESAFSEVFQDTALTLTVRVSPLRERTGKLFSPARTSSSVTAGISRGSVFILVLSVGSIAGVGFRRAELHKLLERLRAEQKANGRIREPGQTPRLQ